jgi:hypothetical protein
MKGTCPAKRHSFTQVTFMLTSLPTSHLTRDRILSIDTVLMKKISRDNARRKAQQEKKRHPRKGVFSDIFHF